MKKILRITALAALAALLVISLASCKKDSSTPDGMKLASNEKADFTLFVPESWTVDMAEAAVGAYCSKTDPSSVSMMAWELENSDSNVDDWWEVNLPEIEKVFSDVEVTSTEDTVIDGLYAKKYVYTAKLGDYEYTIMQAACVKKATVYVFTYESLPESFDSHLSEAADMLANIKIGK